MTGILEGKTIVVTGGGAGIGLGIVRQCVDRGANVIAFEIDEAKAERIHAEGGNFRRVDVADTDQLQSTIKSVGQEFGSISALVNNAGITIQKPLIDLTVQEMDLLWQVNQRAVLVASKSVTDWMPDAGGAILNIASNHARASDKGYEAYAGTKGAIVALTRALAWSLGEFNIRVNSLSPGLTMTEAVQDIASKQDRKAEFSSWHALGTVNSVDDIGRVASFLLSSNAAAITGADIIADQGMSARLGAI